MADLFWPGDERAGDVLTPASFLAAMVQVEAAWLGALVACKIADTAAYDDLTGLVDAADISAIAVGAEGGGNPVIPLVTLLKARVEARNPSAADWLHRSLTSQDVVDTALVLCLRDAVSRLDGELRRQVVALVDLVERNRRSVMSGRTLTQHAVPITFGLKAATWLHGVLDAEDALRSSGPFRVQVGGAAGTLAATAGLTSDPGRVSDLTGQLAHSLGLTPSPPWHTNRGRVTRVSDALVGCTDAWGRIANDVLTLSRPEIAEVAEPTASGRGGSSAMPHKVNPVLSVLIRRAALTGPGLGAQLHLAAAETGDERSAGAWHTEWSTLATLGRRTVVAASQTTEMLEGLTVSVDRMRATAEGASADLLGERRSDVSDLDGYLGLSDWLVDDVLDRARLSRESS